MTEPRFKNEGNNHYVRLNATTNIKKGDLVLWDDEWSTYGDLTQGGAYAVAVNDMKAGEEGWFQTAGDCFVSESDLCALFTDASEALVNQNKN